MSNLEAENWVKNHSFLRTVIFYFDDLPNEMYYVSFVDAGTGDNPNYSRLSIRGVENGNGLWKEFEEFNIDEQKRIAKRFDVEIVKRLEHILGTISLRNDKIL